MSIILDGTNGITSVNGAASLCVAGPAFQAYLGSNQTITNASTTVIQCNTKEFDTAGAYNNTSSTATLNGLSVPAWSFMPPVAGYYQVSIGMQLSTGTGFQRAYQWIYKTGSLYKRVQDTSASAPVSMEGSVLVYLNGSTDYITAYGYVSTTTGTVGFNGGSIDLTYFSASMVRSA